MPKSRFRLASVLDYREQVVDLRQQELARLENELLKEQETLARLRASITALSQDIKSAQQGGALDPGDLMFKFQHLRRLGEQEQRQIARLAEVSERVEAKRTELREAMQDKQVLEKLKERQLAQQRVEENSEESQLMDEIGVMRFLRNEQEKANNS